MLNKFFALVVVIVLTGCANHPLPDDYTNYSTFDIIQKLRCEARSAIVAHIEKENLVENQREITSLKNAHAKYEKWRANNKSTFSKIDKEIADQDNAKKLAKAAAEQTRSVGDKLVLEIAALQIRLSNETDNDKKTKITARINSLETRIPVLLGKFDVAVEAQEELERKTADLEKSHDEILRTIVFPDGSGRRLTQKKYIEIAKGAQDTKKKLVASDLESEKLRNLFLVNNATIAIKLDFRITENDNATADGSVTWPIHLGSISLGYKGGINKGRTAQRVVQVTSLFSELTNPKLLDCSRAPSQPTDGRARIYPITGNVGVDEFVEQYFKISKATNVATGKDTFTDTLTFTTKILGQLNPTIEIKPVSPSLVKGGLDLNADRTDLHVASLQIRPYAPSSKKADPKLHITKIPSVTIKINEGLDGHGSAIDVN